MALPNPKNRRMEPRIFGFKADVTFSLCGGDCLSEIPIRALDVSRRGLGFLIDQRLQTKMEYTLLVGDERFQVEATYCESELGLEDRFRVGIFVRDAEANLIETCIRLGYLDEEDEDEM